MSPDVMLERNAVHNRALTREDHMLKNMISVLEGGYPPLFDYIVHQHSPRHWSGTQIGTHGPIATLEVVFDWDGSVVSHQLVRL